MLKSLKTDKGNDTGRDAVEKVQVIYAQELFHRTQPCQPRECDVEEWRQQETTRESCFLFLLASFSFFLGSSRGIIGIAVYSYLHVQNKSDINNRDRTTRKSTLYSLHVKVPSSTKTHNAQSKSFARELF